MNPRATPGDVAWIDAYGAARVCGHRVHRQTVLDIEQSGDRDAEGRLTAAARERIAVALTQRLRDAEARSLAAWHAAGRPIVWHRPDI